MSEMVHNDKKHKCFTCNKMFGRQGSLTKHIKVVHRGEKNYPCVICNMKFSQKSNLDSHFSRVHEERKICSNSRFECIVCSTDFSTETSLNSHIQMVHENKKLKCTTCNLFCFSKLPNKTYKSCT